MQHVTEMVQKYIFSKNRSCRTLLKREVEEKRPLEVPAGTADELNRIITNEVSGV